MFCLTRNTDIRDVELQMPGKLDEIREWYRVYKVAEGKKENTYAFDGECLPRVRLLAATAASHTSLTALAGDRH